MANLKSVLKCWTEFNLPNLQKSLDQTATETALRQDEAEKGKKQLIDLTKEWKRNTEEAVRTKCAPVIKAFQKEIDTLNKRGKAAESAFLLLYKSLLEIPDPVPVLKKAEMIQKQLEKNKNVELENLKLRETLDEYHSEFADVKNQEVTLNKLKEKIKEYEEKEKQNLQSLVQEKSKDIQAQFDEREQQLLDSKLTIATKLGDAESKIKFLTQELESARVEIFDLRAKHEEEMMGRVSEINLLEADIERANQNLLSAEKYTDSLKTQFTTDNQFNLSNNLSNEADTELIKSLEYQLSAKERELSQFMEEVHHLQSSSSRTKDTLEKEIASLEATIAEKNDTISMLEGRLKDQEDYGDMKRELNVLKMIEFNSTENQDELGCAKPLEKLLLEKNKALLSECTQVKVQNGELTCKCEELQKNCTDAHRTVKDQRELILQLESDLMNVQKLPSSIYRGEGVGAASPPTNTELVTKAIQDVIVDLDEDAGKVDKHTADSLLPIISSQRERFRTKNLELEAQTRQQQREITNLQNEVATVRQDNIKLYEKIKFLQSYPNKGQSSPGSIEDESVKRYSSQYEERIDPFAVFSRKEKQQRYSNLSAPEKVTLSMGRFILSNKIARTLVFFYTIILHLLVFVVLYKFAYYETQQCKPSVIIDSLNMAAADAVKPLHRVKTGGGGVRS